MSQVFVQNDIDEHVDDEILRCLNIESPKSFFLFAGAGSGKTRTLVKVLDSLRQQFGERLRLYAKRIAVITYTNAACEVIRGRLGADDLFSVSTIHSFTWELIKPFQTDIREWLRIRLKEDLVELASQQAKSKSLANKTSIERASKIRSKTKRLDSLDLIRCFTYNPNGENRGRDSLNHSEVISLGAYFISSTTLGKEILSQRFPILLIDESQDTNKELMDAFLAAQEAIPNSFSLGLIGDTMQRIYSDGKVDLGQNVPTSWITPKKVMNHRCPKRIIKLINKIRNSVDGLEQVPRTDSKEGIVRLFLVPQRRLDKISIENEISKRMSRITGDPLWDVESSKVQILTLEHHMAANRMGFLPLFMPMYEVEKYKTGLLDGSQPGLQVLINSVLPIIKAYFANNDFEVAKIAKANSPLYTSKVFSNSANQMELFKSIDLKVKQLASLWDDGNDPKLSTVFSELQTSGLFEVHDSVIPALEVSGNLETPENYSDEQNEDDSAWRKVLDCPFSMLEKYCEYVSNNARFGTHQGVKGLEFERVMVILDDEEAKGFLFSYEKLFGVKEKSKADLDNESTGKDTGISRTLRLFYVTCSRAKESLAIVAYTQNPAIIKEFAIRNGWFDEAEIIEMSGDLV